MLKESTRFLHLHKQIGASARLWDDTRDLDRLFEHGYTALLPGFLNPVFVMMSLNRKMMLASRDVRVRKQGRYTMGSLRYLHRQIARVNSGSE